jgi:redox-sensitive bicupin YhaK (pirin superfamily)
VEVGLFDSAGQSIHLEFVKNTTVLLLSGEPIDEPIVGRGPFLMSSAQEIRQAMADLQSATIMN